MRVFKINENIEVVCETKKTRNGFKHEATLIINGSEKSTAKICYLNRTWEKYEFESVMEKLIKMSNLPVEEIKICTEFLKGDLTDWTDFKRISAIAKMGEVLTSNIKEKNDWKARMLKAGLGNKGLTMPEDWDSLDENTKEDRLNAVIKLMEVKA